MLSGESERSYITGLSGGSIQIGNIPANAPSSLNAGNLGAVITSSQDLGIMQVSRSHMSAFNPTNSLQTGIQRSFVITPSNDAGLNATLRFYYLDAELNGKDPNSLGLWSSNDGVNWSFRGADSRDPTQKFVEKTGIASFSTWTLTDAANPLPVRLLSFSAVCGDNTVVVKWATASETGFSTFVLEKSTDAVGWNAIATIAGHNDPLGSSYSYTDVQAIAKVFYRLKMVDKDGNYTYSPVFSGGGNDLTMPFAVYPNPAHTSTTARISSRQAGSAAIRIFNATGQSVLALKAQIAPGSNAIPLPISGLSSGAYFVQAVLSTGEIEQGSFVKE